MERKIKNKMKAVKIRRNKIFFGVTVSCTYSETRKIIAKRN